MEILVSQSRNPQDNILIITENPDEITQGYTLSPAEQDFLSESLKREEQVIHLARYPQHLIIVHQKADSKRPNHKAMESWRRLAEKGFKAAESIKSSSIQLHSLCSEQIALAFLEGFALSAYQFEKHKSKPKPHQLKSITWTEGNAEALAPLQAKLKGVFFARDLVNEPLSHLTAEDLALAITKQGKESGFSVEVWGKEKIEAEKMGGILAVNRGGPNPPTFTIMEWKPQNAKNKKPLVLVGKGVVYDTGGVSLKPTANSMDLMKSDMGGAATVAGAMTAIAEAELPFHVIGLIPATENRPGANAYVPGDIITMHDGSKVEVLNTDAEGRMILADALSYAKNYQPEACINVATLTGAAAYAIGPFGIVSMGDWSSEKSQAFAEAGEASGEPLAPFPFWEDYDELIQSEIADIKNLGGPFGGAITAGKFLKHFTDYPLMHLDIAGPAFLTSPLPYRPKGGTGVGVRLIFEYLTRKSNG